MTLRTEQSVTEFQNATASRTVPVRSPIAFEAQSTLGDRIIAAARAAAAMHLTGAALISADEAAILALDSRESRS